MKTEGSEMFSVQVIDPKSEVGRVYFERRKLAFPRLELEVEERAVHIGVFHDDQLLGGASCSAFTEVSEDPVLLRHWRMSGLGSGTRISRLWTEKEKPAAALIQLFKGLHERLPDGGFLYGILALPLGFARRHAAMIERSAAELEGGERRFSPALPLSECDWAEGSEASSEGRRLYSVYQRLGAVCLGPASGDASDHSVRIVLGLMKEEVRLDGVLSRRRGVASGVPHRERARSCAV
jgi:hypothetical protein